MACSGNSAEICGGPNRLDLYQYIGSVGKMWNSLGCYTDSVSARSLTWAQTIPNGPSTLTVELCQQLCQNAGYSLAGVEYSVECCMFYPFSVRFSPPFPFFLCSIISTLIFIYTSSSTYRDRCFSRSALCLPTLFLLVPSTRGRFWCFYLHSVSSIQAIDLTRLINW